METILIAIISLIVGFWLGKLRDQNIQIFNKKLEIYSDIVCEINTVKYMQVELNRDKEKLKTLYKEADNLQHEGKKNDLKEYTTRLQNIRQRQDDTEKADSILNYKYNLIKLFAPARLIGSDKVITEIIEYTSLIGEYYSTDNKDQKEKIADRIDKSTMELEQLMREDLGKSRNLSRLDLWMHHNYKK